MLVVEGDVGVGVSLRRQAIAHVPSPGQRSMTPMTLDASIISAQKSSGILWKNTGSTVSRVPSCAYDPGRQLPVCRRRR